MSDMVRQTFYVSGELSNRLKQKAHKSGRKLSALVNDALRAYLQEKDGRQSSEPALLKYAGKVHSFDQVDPISFQRALRDEWQ